MNFANRVEDIIQLIKYSRDICYYHVQTILFSMSNVTAMSEHQKGSHNLDAKESNLLGTLSPGLYPSKSYMSCRHYTRDRLTEPRSDEVIIM